VTATYCVKGVRKNMEHHKMLSSNI